MAIVAQFPLISSTPPPVLLLPAPPKRPALPMPKIAGYLPAPNPSTLMSITPVRREKRVVAAEIANPAHLLDTSEHRASWEQIQHLLGPQKSQAEREADVLAYVFGTPDYRAQKDAENRARRDDMARFMAEWRLA